MSSYLGGAYSSQLPQFSYDPSYANRLTEEAMLRFQGDQQQNQQLPQFDPMELVAGWGGDAASSAFKLPDFGLGSASAGVPDVPVVVNGVPAAGASPWGLSGFGTAGNYLGPIAGAIGAGDLLFNGGDYSEGRGALQGALSGAAMGSYFGPWGTAIGGIGGGLVGLGRSMFDKGPRTEVEDGRVRALTDKGVSGYDQLFKATKDKNAWYNPSLGADYIGYSPDGTWTNNKFSKSRNESDLRPEDVWGYSAWGEKFGNEWLGTSEENRRKIAEEALRRGLINESRGSINLRSDGSFDQFARDQLDGKNPQNGMQSTSSGASTPGKPTLGVAAGGVGKSLPMIPKLPQSNGPTQNKPYRMGSGASPQTNLIRDDKKDPKKPLKRLSFRIPVANYSGGK